MIRCDHAKKSAKAKIKLTKIRDTDPSLLKSSSIAILKKGTEFWANYETKTFSTRAQHIAATATLLIMTGQLLTNRTASVACKSTPRPFGRKPSQNSRAPLKS